MCTGKLEKALRSREEHLSNTTTRHSLPRRQPLELINDSLPSSALFSLSFHFPTFSLSLSLPYSPSLIWNTLDLHSPRSNEGKFHTDVLLKEWKKGRQVQQTNLRAAFQITLCSCDWRRTEPLSCERVQEGYVCVYVCLFFVKVCEKLWHLWFNFHRWYASLSTALPIASTVKTDSRN